MSLLLYNYLPELIQRKYFVFYMRFPKLLCYNHVIHGPMVNLITAGVIFYETEAFNRYYFDFNL